MLVTRMTHMYVLRVSDREISILPKKNTQFDQGNLRLWLLVELELALYPLAPAFLIYIIVKLLF